MDNIPISIKSMKNLSLNKLNWISRFSPSFFLNGSQISILREPKDFYSKLQELTASSNRIILASLYYGTGDLEQGMIQNLQTSLLGSDKKNLQIKVILDYNRGSRGQFNSRTMFLPLIQSYPHNVQLSLFHSPLLRGFFKKILPSRFNEIMGLFHMKIYIGDDDIIISGANLNDTYFTDRQDRYVHISKCPQLSNYFDELLSIISKYSFHVKSDGTEDFDSNYGHPFKSHKQNEIFCEKLKKEMESFIEKWKAISNLDNSSKDKYDTVLHPLIQMGPIGITQDEIVTTKLLISIPSNTKINIATGYFNLTSIYIDEILKNKKVEYSIITASPQANSFYQSAGLSGYITDVYTHIASSFFKKIVTHSKGTNEISNNKGIHLSSNTPEIKSLEKSNEINQQIYSDLTSRNSQTKLLDQNIRDSQLLKSDISICNKIPSYTFMENNKNNNQKDNRINLYEYAKKKWTFHAKGLWYYPPNQELPNFSIVGSSNFGYRSIERDIEMQLCIITENKDLQIQLHNEQCDLFKNSNLVDESTFKDKSRKVSLLILLIFPFISNFF